MDEAMKEIVLPLGAPFRPGLDPLPTHHEAWAVVKDAWGRPAHGEPVESLRRVRVPVPTLGPNDVLGYVLYAGLTYNTIFAARGVPVSVFDMHDQDVHVAGSGAVVLVAALGGEAAREGRLKIGELRVLYPGVSNLLSPRAGDDPMHADFKIQGYETPDGSFAQFVRGQAPQLLAHSERLTLPEGSSFMLDLETVYKALYDVARVRPGERVFVEGAAGGTGIYAVACAALRGATVTGLVSTEEKAALIRQRGASAHVNRKSPAMASVFTPVPADPHDVGRVGCGGARTHRCRERGRRRVVGRPRPLRAHGADPGAGRAARFLRRDERLHADVPRQAGRGHGGHDAGARGAPAARRRAGLPRRGWRR
jgi:acrylyl-CoA reductase (NADPH)/3-hydroxypropionyl-CoA dehydratase/3-hydroxypropionyl-CoA synthetase